jgi:hypothetical protein
MATNTNTTNTARTRGTSKADLLISLLGAHTLEERVSVIAEQTPSKSVLRKAAVEVRNRNNDIYNALEAYANTQGYSVIAHRGRYGPRVGETRVYNVQRIKDDATFIRLPLSSLEVSKGAKVRVDFEDGEIVVRAMA